MCLLLCWGYSLIQILVVTSTERTKNAPNQFTLLVAISGQVTLVSAINNSVTGMIHTPSINLANLPTLFSSLQIPVHEVTQKTCRVLEPNG